MTSTTDDPMRTLRTSVLALAGLTIVGVASELAIERHWGTDPVRYIPWLCLIALAASVYALAQRPTSRAVRAIRGIAGAVIAASALGIAFHVTENYNAGPLDQRYETLWGAMNEPARWWAAFTKAVGPAPTLAPGALAQVAILVLIATRRHPALSGGFIA